MPDQDEDLRQSVAETVEALQRNAVQVVLKADYDALLEELESLRETVALMTDRAGWSAVVAAEESDPATWTSSAEMHELMRARAEREGWLARFEAGEPRPATS